MSESPDWGESPSVDNSSKYTPARRTYSPPPSYSSGESPSGESPSDNWARPTPPPVPTKTIYVPVPVPTPSEPPKKNKRYKL